MCIATFSFYRKHVGGFVDEDNVDPANYLKELIDTFK